MNFIECQMRLKLKPFGILASIDIIVSVVRRLFTEMSMSFSDFYRVDNFQYRSPPTKHGRNNTRYLSLTILYCRKTTQSQTLEVTAGNILHSRLERCYWKERYNHNQPYRRKLHQQIASLWSKWLGLPSLCAKLAGRDGDRMVGWMEMDIIWNPTIFNVIGWVAGSIVSPTKRLMVQALFW